jgi:hypothetical protein
MSWLIDNVNIVYLLLGIVALGFVTSWWLTKRVKFLICASGVLALIVVAWLLTLVVVTDQHQIQKNVQEMADAVVAGDPRAVLKHCSRDFRHKQMTREQLADLVQKVATKFKITEVKIREFESKDASRATGTAKARFRATVFDKDGVLAVVFCIADFTLEEGQWKLKAIDFRDGRNPDQPMPGAP